MPHTPVAWQRLGFLLGDDMKHGMNRTPTHISWKQMHGRCRNPKTKSWADYGGRGIRVCERWSGRDGFTNFLADLGARPSLSHTIDRIDNDGHYEPGNCRWSVRVEQNRNRRSNAWIEHNGERKTIAEWAESAPVSPQLLRTRLVRYGWTFDRAMTTPPMFTPRPHTKKPARERSRAG